MLLRIPFQGTSHVGTSLGSGGEQIPGSFPGVDSQLGAQNAAGGGKQVGIGAAFSGNQVGKHPSGDHGGGHTPLIKACRNI